MSLISGLLLVQFLISSITHGPMLGDLTSDSVRIWLRTDTPEKVTIVLRDLASDPPSFHHYPQATTADSDSTFTLHARYLKPNTKYTYTINGVEHDDWWFKTRPVQDETVRIAFGSCADEKDGSSNVWNRMNADHIDAFVLLGDAPYIDTTDLTIQQQRYKTFSNVPAFASLVAHTPLIE